MGKYISSLVENEHGSAELKNFWDEQAAWSDKRFFWFYSNNSYGKSETVILNQEGSKTVVGVCSYFVRKFFVGDEQVMGGVNCDALVDAEHRTLGPAIMLMKTLIEVYPKKNIDFLFGFPNNKSKPLLTRCGYKEIGEFCRWSKILNYEKKISKKMKNKLLVKVSSLVIDMIVRLLSGELTYKYFALSKKISLEKVSLSDWHNSSVNEGKCSTDMMICGGRGRGYVEWRYADAADSLDYSICAVKIKGHTIGYLVYSLDDGIAIIHDISPMSIGYFKSTLIEFSILAKKLNVDSISVGFLGGQQYLQVFKKLFFLQRESRSVMLYCNNEKLQKKLLSKQDWYLMDGDVDL